MPCPPQAGYHEGNSVQDTLYGRGTCTTRALLTAEVNSACAALAARPPEGVRGPRCVDTAVVSEKPECFPALAEGAFTPHLASL